MKFIFLTLLYIQIFQRFVYTDLSIFFKKNNTKNDIYGNFETWETNSKLQFL